MMNHYYTNKKTTLPSISKKNHLKKCVYFRCIVELSNKEAANLDRSGVWGEGKELGKFALFITI